MTKFKIPELSKRARKKLAAHAHEFVAAIQETPPDMEIDLHGYHPDDIDVCDIVKQAWEIGAARLRLIHGHAHWRGRSVGFKNTNTGYFGLRIRSTLRHNPALKPWVKRSTLYCGHDGSTTISLKPNPDPSRTEIDLPERRQREKFG